MYIQLAYFHLATVVPAFIIATYLLLSKKGSKQHRNLGKFYMFLMLITSVTTFFMPAHVGPRFFNHFGYIHILSVITVITISYAYYAVKFKNILAHKISMISLYIGGFIIAGSFAVMPGRLLHTWLFGQ